jgi:hypothetical protein
MGTSKLINLVPLIDLKFLMRARRNRCTNFKSAALVPFTVISKSKSPENGALTFKA